MHHIGNWDVKDCIGKWDAKDCIGKGDVEYYRQLDGLWVWGTQHSALGYGYGREEWVLTVFLWV